MKTFRTKWEPSDAESEATESDVKRLRGTIRDLVVLSALPSIWVDCDLRQSLQNLTDVLCAALRAFTVCVRVELPDGSRFDSAAADGLTNDRNYTFNATELLDAVTPGATGPILIAKSDSHGPLNGLPYPIFFEARQIGYFAAFHPGNILPSENDRLLLQVAANQIMLLLQRHKDQEERLARKLAEERLRQTEHHYQQLLQTLPAAVYTCDNSGRITLYNEAAVRLWGRRPKIGEDTICGSWMIYNPDGSPLALENCPMAIAMREGRSIRGQEIIIERPDGTRSHVLPHPDPMRNEDGKIIGAVNMLVEVDGLKRAEHALRASEARMVSLLTLLPVAVYTCDAHGRITFYNHRAAELWGREPHLNDDQNKFCGAYKCWLDGKVVPPEQTPMAVAVRESKAFRDIEPVIERPDGVKLSVHVNIDPLFDAEGRSIGAINVFQDITQLKRSEEELRRKTNQLATFLETAALGLHRVGPDGIIQWANAAEMELLGYTAEEYIGHHIGEFHADQPVINDILQQLSSGQKLQGYEARLRCKDGSIRHVMIDSSVLWENGQFIHTQCFTRDVSERKGAVRLLEAQKTSLEMLVQGAPLKEVLTFLAQIVEEQCGGQAVVSILLLDEEGRLRDGASPGLPEDYIRAIDGIKIRADLGTCSRAAAINECVVTPDIDADPYWQSIKHLPLGLGFKGAWSRPINAKDGRVLGTFGTYLRECREPSVLERQIVEILSRTAALAIEGRHAEEALRKRGERLLLLSETLGQLLSAREPQVIVRELFAKVADHLGVDTCINFMVDEKGKTLRLHSATGIPEEVAQSINRLEFGQAICGTVAQTRQAIHASDIQNSTYDKANLVREWGIQSYACNPLIVGGRLLGTLSFASHERKTFDKEELQFLRIISQYTAIVMERLQNSEQLEKTVNERTAKLSDTVNELEAFSYSIAHDMRGPLRSMSSYSRIIEEDFASLLPEQGKDYLRRIAASAQRLDALITDVLNYSKISRSEMLLEPVNVEKLIREIIDSYPDLRDSERNIDVQSPIPRVIGNPAAITQCVSNLLSNALKFCDPGTTARVCVRGETRGDTVRIWVEDNGIGISEEGQKRIFHMFQRLNPAAEFEGTGIGLTIVRKCVERMGGQVGVESKAREGSRFWIELKRA